MRNIVWYTRTKLRGLMLVLLMFFGLAEFVAYRNPKGVGWKGWYEFNGTALGFVDLDGHTITNY